MQKQVFYFLLALALPAFFACNNRAKIDTLQKETEAIHDEAMKDMADMNRFSRSIKKELAALDSLPTPPPRRDSLIDAIATMGKAEEGMMAWMAQYKSPEDMPNDAALKYLQEQKQLIEQSRKELETGLAIGKKWSGQ